MRIRTASMLLAFAITISACHDAGSEEDAALSVTLAPASGSVIKGGTLQTTAVVSRNDYEGEVTVTVGPLPAGVTSSVGVVETSGTVSTALITLTTSEDSPTGTSNIAITAHGEGVANASRNYALTISPPASSNLVGIDVALCATKPIWLAVQDGSGPFTRVFPGGDLYQFQLTSAQGTVAYVVPVGAGFSIGTVTYDRVKWLEESQTVCNPPTITVSATLTGIPASAQATFAVSSGLSTFRTSNGTINQTGVRTGLTDITAWLRGAAVDRSGDRGLVRRAQNLVTSTNLGTLDFAGAESFAPAIAPINITGLTLQELPGLTMFHHSLVGGQCGSNLLYDITGVGSLIAASGFPDERQAAGEFHEAFVSGIEANGDYRGVGAIFRTMAAKTITLPTALPALTVTTQPALYRRLQTSFVLPSEYAGEMYMQYFQDVAPTGRSVTMRVQTSTTAGQALTIGLPDFSGVSGWDPTWGPSTTAGGTWYFYAYNDVSACVEGNRALFSFRNGAY